MSVQRAEILVKVEGLKLEMLCVSDVRDMVNDRIKTLKAEIDRLKEYRKFTEDFPSYKAINASRHAVEGLRIFSEQVEERRKALSARLKQAHDLIR
jgi:uncharacterized small protein (DUF1192 family)